MWFPHVGHLKHLFYTTVVYLSLKSGTGDPIIYVFFFIHVLMLPKIRCGQTTVVRVCVSYSAEIFRSNARGLL